MLAAGTPFILARFSQKGIGSVGKPAKKGLTNVRKRTILRKSDFGRKWRSPHGPQCLPDAHRFQPGDEEARRRVPQRREKLRHLRMRVLDPLHAAGGGEVLHAGGDLRISHRAEADGPLRAEKAGAVHSGFQGWQHFHQGLVPVPAGIHRGLSPNIF